MKKETQQIFLEIKNREQEFMIDGDFTGKDIISVEQLSIRSVELVMKKTLEIKHWFKNGMKEKYQNKLAGKKIGIFFWEPSTRTQLSFVEAARNLGAEITFVPGMMTFSSAYKGETLHDTMRMLEGYGYNAIVMRHPADDSSLEAALAVQIPIINGGSGSLEHPTQSLLDLFTFMEETRKTPAEMEVVFMGDLKHGRTVHSGVKLLAKMGIKKIGLVSPPALRLPSSLYSYLNKHQVSVWQAESIYQPNSKIVDPRLVNSDVLYVTRVQKERFKNPQEAENLDLNGYKITTAVMDQLSPTTFITHPLPRVGEIEEAVDQDPRAAYFRQAENGLYARMVLLDLILGKAQNE